MTICPNCGRELQAAPSRLWTWILPLGVVVLLAIFWFSRSGGPVSWAGDQADRVVVWVTGMGAEMDPQMTILTTPDADTPVLELVSAGTDDPDQVDTDGALLSDPGLADGEAASGETAVALLPTNTPLAEPPAPTEIVPTEIVPTETATTAPTATATVAPTATSTDIPTEAPTSNADLVADYFAHIVAHLRTCRDGNHRQERYAETDYRQIKSVDFAANGDIC